MSYSLTTIASELCEHMDSILDDIGDILSELRYDGGEEGVREKVDEWNECLSFINETLNINRPLINVEDYI